MSIPVAKHHPYFTGFDAKILRRSVKKFPYFLKTIRRYNTMSPRSTFRISFTDLFPILTDAGESAGSVGGHYFHQDLWAAKKIRERTPEEHIDIGSRIDGFITHLLVFMPVTVVDIRPLESVVDGLTFFQDDATELVRFPTGSSQFRFQSPCGGALRSRTLFRPYCSRCVLQVYEGPGTGFGP